MTPRHIKPYKILDWLTDNSGLNLLKQNSTHLNQNIMTYHTDQGSFCNGYYVPNEPGNQPSLLFFSETDYHTNQESFNNGYSAPNMRAHQDSFIVNPTLNTHFDAPLTYGTPAMPARTYEPVKIEPIKFEPIKIEPIKFEPIKIEPIKIDPFKFKL